MKDTLGLILHWLGFIFSCFLILTGVYGSITLYEGEPLFNYFLFSIWTYLIMLLTGNGLGWFLRRLLSGPTRFFPWMIFEKYSDIREIRTLSDIDEIWLKEKILPPFEIKPDSSDLEYNCGCGDTHKINDSHHMASATPKKYLLFCGKSIATFVAIQKEGDNEIAASQWFVRAKTLRKIVVRLGI